MARGQRNMGRGTELLWAREKKYGERERVTVGEVKEIQGREIITSGHKKERAERDSSVEKEEDAGIKERKYILTVS